MQKKQLDENIWESRYQANTTGWDRGKASSNLLDWLESGNLKPCRILVPGCGNGYEVLTLAEKGFDVTAVDIAPTPIANLQKSLDDNQLSAELVESDFFSLDYSDNGFDAIYEQTCLCALPPSEWSNFEQWLYQSLKTGGKLYSQFMQTHQEGGPPFHCDMTEMKQLFSSERWNWTKEIETQGIKELDEKTEIPCLLEKTTALYV